VAKAGCQESFNGIPSESSDGSKYSDAAFPPGGFVAKSPHKVLWFSLVILLGYAAVRRRPVSAWLEITSLEAVLEEVDCKPDICSLDCGTMNFAGDYAYINTAPFLRRMAEIVQELGVKPELEVFDLGQIRLARSLIDDGLIDAPPMFQLCLGIPWGAGADTETMTAMKQALPADAVWAGFGISRMQMPMVAQAVLLGGNVRVGLEDNIYLDKGVLASNGMLVERAVEAIGQPHASASSTTFGRPSVCDEIAISVARCRASLRTTGSLT